MNKSLVILAITAVGLAGCGATQHTQKYYEHHQAAMKKVVKKCDAANNLSRSQRNNCSAASGAESYLINQSIANRVLANPNG
jgi:outer membrane lipoprotein SlyB